MHVEVELTEAAPRRMTIEEYFRWDEPQTEKYELVQGIPVRMMIGASRQHDRIVVNIIVSLGNQLRGNPCSPCTSNTAVRTGPDTIRRPDAGVDCGPFRPDDRMASEPTLVVEVLSPSTHVIDLFAKTDEYRDVATISYVLLIEPNEPRVLLLERDEANDWRHRLVEGLDETIGIDRLGIHLPLAEIYADLPLPPRPRLIGEGVAEEEASFEAASQK